MLKKLWESLINWYEIRKINKWYNWEFLEYEWCVIHESPTHIYEERMSKFINIHTGQIRSSSPYYRRKSRFKNSQDYRITVKNNRSTGM
jgi:hypothetical protein